MKSEIYGPFGSTVSMSVETFHMYDVSVCAAVGIFTDFCLLFVQACVVVGMRVLGDDGFRYWDVGYRIPSHHKSCDVSIRRLFCITSLY